MKMWMLAAILICGTAAMFTSCAANEDNATPTPTPTPEPTADIPAQLKQGVWTEYDTILVAAGKYTAEELAEMPSVGMMIEGDMAYFFTYTADGADELVEGQISYDKTTGTGTITFPAIADNPLSGQTVSFTATSDEMLEFELSYEGQKMTATCSWLCENLDGWNSDDEGDWEELLTYYQNFPEDAGPDPSIDWSDSEVEGLDQPLTWDDGTAATRGGTRMATAIIEGVSAGLDIFSSLFEEDPADQINEKLDVVLGKLDNVLANQQQIKIQLTEVNERLKAIAETMKKDKILDIFNERNKDFYNPLKDQNDQYFGNAYDLYKKNKSDLSKVSKDLSEYAKLWAGSNEEYIKLTWQYIEYLATVKTSYYGTGMASIYDGLTFEKYPWEHLGIGDRTNYRAYDMFMISQSLFMINLYAAYGGLSTKQMEGLYELYKNKKPLLKAFCEFKVSDPQKFRVCQIKGAHFIMHKELQKYRFCGPDNKCPHPDLYGGYDALYRPEWHQTGTINIDNPKELKSKLISVKEAYALYDYYKAIYKQEDIHWADILVEHIIDKKNVAGGADYALAPKPNNGALTFLMLHDPEHSANGVNFVDDGKSLGICPVVSNRWSYGTSVIPAIRNSWHYMGTIYSGIILSRELKGKWRQYNENIEYYGAIVETRY